MGWELKIVREREDWRSGDGRTVGRYAVFHNERPIAELQGFTVEPHGPGDNATMDNGRRIEVGLYPLFTWGGTNYRTIGYASGYDRGAPLPGIQLQSTRARTEILVHPAFGFKKTVGCINLSDRLDSVQDDIDGKNSVLRVIALIDDLRSFLGSAFPLHNDAPIPEAYVSILGEP